MREITFRGKRDYDGKWLEGDLRQFKDGVFIEYHTGIGKTSDPVLSKTVGQFTGLTDKNGTKIFEGDVIISYDIFGKEYGRGIVTWNKTLTGWHYDRHKSMYDDGISKYEVIGNIHDNPELIGGADNG